MAKTWEDDMNHRTRMFAYELRQLRPEMAIEDINDLAVFSITAQEMITRAAVRFKGKVPLSVQAKIIEKAGEIAIAKRAA